MKKIMLSSLIVSLLLSNQIKLDTINVLTDIGGNNSYTKTRASTATGMELTQKDTPQSVSVITQKQLEDRGIHNLDDALKTATGINVSKDSSGVIRYQSRGFYMDYIQVDGINTNVKTQSLFNEKIDTKAPTDTAIYESVEIVRGATGLMQSNGEPGGTVNLLRKKPTYEFQHLGEILFDENKKRRIMLDFSGALNKDGTIRARAVGSASDYDTFRDRVDGDSKMIYSTIEFDIGANSVLGLGGMYQNTNEVPVIFGIPLPYERPSQEVIDNMSSQQRYQFNMIYNGKKPANLLPRSTYLGADWSNTETDKHNIFTTFDHYFENDWHLGMDLSYTKTKSDMKVAELGIRELTHPRARYGIEHGHEFEEMRALKLDKKDEQLGFKIDLSGDYELFNQEHQFYIAYNYNREKTKYNYKTRTVQGHGYCECKRKNRNGRCLDMVNTKTHYCVSKGHPDYEKLKKKFEEAKAKNNFWDYFETYGMKSDLNSVTFNGSGINEPNWDIIDDALLDDDYARLLELDRKLDTHTITASTRINPTDELHFLLGGSYTWYDYKKKHNLRYDIGSILLFKAGDQDSIYYEEKCETNNQSDNCKIIDDSNEKFIPFLSITYDITPNHSIYASYTEIFKHQDGETPVTGVVYDADLDDYVEKTTGWKALKPIEGKSYEIGYKALLNDDKLNLSIALFKIEQENMAIRKAGDSTNAYQIDITPAGKVESKGVELEIAGEILDGFHMIAGYTYNESEYKNEVNFKKPGENYSKHTPEHMFKLYASYKIPNTKFTIGGGLTAQSETYGLYNIKQGGYTIYDAHINYEISDNMSVNLIGTNLGDKRYFENNINRTRGVYNFYGKPRTVAMKFDWKF